MSEPNRLNRHTTYLMRDKIACRIAELRLDRYSPNGSLIKLIYADRAAGTASALYESEWVEIGYFRNRYELVDSIPDTVRPD